MEENPHIIYHTQVWKGYTDYFLMLSDGTGMIWIRKSVEDERPVYEMGNLFVNKICRGKGLGDFLMFRAIHLCKKLSEHGLIRLDVSENSEEFCEDWYNRLGFETKGACTALPLKDDSADSEDQEWYKMMTMEF